MIQLIFGICVRVHVIIDKVFRTRVLRGISRSKRDETAGGWRNPTKKSVTT
jgi:hypothetical protein